MDVARVLIEVVGELEVDVGAELDVLAVEPLLAVDVLKVDVLTVDVVVGEVDELLVDVGEVDERLVDVGEVDELLVKQKHSSPDLRNIAFKNFKKLNWVDYFT